MRIRLYVLTLPNDNRIWAVLHVRLYPLTNEHGLLVRCGDEERTVVVDHETYVSIFNPETNPPRWFGMEE